MPLLKRLAAEKHTHNMSTNDWMREIGESLQMIFNTHEGSAAIRSDYGMPEFHPEEMSNILRLQQKANELKALIEHFEPRLRQVRVEGRQDDSVTGRALFEVHGVLDESLAGGRVFYQTIMTGNGRVLLRN